jgi:replicative DNA helicase
MNDLLIHNQPHSEEAEDKLIATCLIDGDSSVYDSVSQVVDVDDFYTLRGKLVFQALGDMAAAGEPFEDLTLMERLKASKGLDEVGGIAGIMAMAGRACMVSQVDYYANVVLEKSKLRELMRSCRVAVEQAESESVTYDVIRSNLETEITSRPSEAVNQASISNSAKELMEEIKQMQDGTYVPDVVKTHLGRLDEMLGNRGIAAGEVLTLAAPTSCGKSALALYIASQSVSKDNTSCAVFSLEMPQKQLTKRLLQVISGVNMMTILDNTANDSEKKRVHEATQKLYNDMPIFTSHSVKSADDLVSQTRQFVQKNGVKLVIIDYLQLIPFSSKMGKAEGIASISHKIKQMALDLNIAVILLAQVNREGAKRGPLELYDLKDSGDIENDADVVLLMYPSKGSVEESKDTDHKGAFTSLNYKLAKNREGERGIGCFFKFYHCTGRFD